jgi:hypothetical protein
MNAAPLPTTLTAAHDLIRRLQWQVAQLQKELFGPSSERRVEPTLSKEQILLLLFPAPAATSEPVLVAEDDEAEPRPRRQAAATALETVTERLEPSEKVCPHCGQPKCEIGCERIERFEYVPAIVIRHEIVRPKLACRCSAGGVSIAPLPAQVEATVRVGTIMITRPSARRQPM